MQTDGDDTAHRAPTLEGALGEALAGLPDGHRAAAPETVDYRWLAAGMRLGLERPAQARGLLEMIGDAEADPGTSRGGDAGGDLPSGGPATEGPGGGVQVPVPSSLLARAAALPWAERAGMAPEVMFGWVAGLAPGEILSLGRVVGDMLAAGSSANVGRGFGLAWDAGVRLPRRERSAMFREFAELEVTVGGVLAGHDLRAGEQAPQPGGLGAIFGMLVTRARPQETQAAAAVEGSGEPGRRGLVALWNVWVAMRYRSRIPQPTFELLVRPWVTVVGALPEP
jgi:hypothetical protein